MPPTARGRRPRAKTGGGVRGRTRVSPRADRSRAEWRTPTSPSVWVSCGLPAPRVASLRLIDSRVNNHPLAPPFRRRAVDASRRCPWGTRPWVPMRPVGPSLRRPPSHPLHLRQKKKKKARNKTAVGPNFFLEGTRGRKRARAVFAPCAAFRGDQRALFRRGGVSLRMRVRRRRGRANAHPRIARGGRSRGGGSG